MYFHFLSIVNIYFRILVVRWDWGIGVLSLMSTIAVSEFQVCRSSFVRAVSGGPGDHAFGHVLFGILSGVLNLKLTGLLLASHTQDGPRSR